MCYRGLYEVNPCKIGDLTGLFGFEIWVWEMERLQQYCKNRPFQNTITIPHFSNQLLQAGKVKVKKQALCKGLFMLVLNIKKIYA